MEITDQLTRNAGLASTRWFNMSTPISSAHASAWSIVRLEGTTFHAGFARYFTPPPQSLAAPVNIAPYANTTLQPEVTLNSPARPERSSYLDAGATQKILPGLEAGVDAYYKRARNLLDDGQFGQALVLTTFNYDRAYNTGVEFKANYQFENFRAYANFAWARQRATQVSSSQYLFGADEYAYILNNYIYTDHAQTSDRFGRDSDLWNGTRLSADLIYGSGLRSGFANTEHVSPYAQLNLGVTHEFANPGSWRWSAHAPLRRDQSLRSCLRTEEMGRASAFSRRNLDRAGDFSPGCRKSSELKGPGQAPSKRIIVALLRRLASSSWRIIKVPDDAGASWILHDGFLNHERCAQLMG